MRYHSNFLISLAITTALVGCSSSDGDEAAGSGNLTVLLESEDTITEGIAAGSDAENIQDGWTVTFDKYVIVIGDVEVTLATDESVERHDESTFAVDLTAIPAAGEPLWEINDLRAGEWSFFYATKGAGDGATAHSSVDATDFDAMVAADATYLLEGTVSSEDGLCCPPSSLAAPPAGESPVSTNAGGDACFATESAAFRLLIPAETVFGPCEVDEVPGFSVAADGTTSVAATIHGDHPFFNGFPEGSEGGVMRLAQWLVDCDLNVDGVVTKEELESISPSDLPEIDERYQLGGSPITPLDNMWDYVMAQLKTQGHFQGEGECPYDGIAHEHGEDHDHDH